MSYFYSISTLAAAFIIIGCFLLFALIFQFLVRKHIPTLHLKPFHDAIGPIVGTLGVLYSVLVAFILVQAQQRNIDVRATIETEAALIADIYRDAAAFSAKDRDGIRSSLVDYVDYILKEERGSTTPSTDNLSLFLTTQPIWDAFYAIDPKTEKEKAWFSQSIDKLNIFNAIKMKRLISGSESLGWLLWIVLIFGALLTICSIYLFHIDNYIIQLVLTIIIGSTVAFILYVILIFDNPYWQDSELTYNSFKDLKILFDKWV